MTFLFYAGMSVAYFVIGAVVAGLIDSDVDHEGNEGKIGFFGVLFWPFALVLGGAFYIYEASRLLGKGISQSFERRKQKKLRLQKEKEAAEQRMRIEVEQVEKELEKEFLTLEQQQEEKLAGARMIAEKIDKAIFR